MTALEPLDPTLVYLAEPIDQRNGNRTTIALGLQESLRMAGFGIFTPRGAFMAPILDPRVEKINRAALYQADAIVACLPAGVATIGVPAEIEAATARGIPAIVLTDVESQALAGNRLVTVIDHPASAPEAVRHAVKTHPRAEPGALRLVIRDGFNPPSRTYDDDAGIDLTTAIGVTIEPKGFQDIHTQVTACEMPPGYWGLITGRSSVMRRRGLLVPNGIIDPGWRGPLFVGVYNPSNAAVNVMVGDRLGQLILIPNHPAPINAVDAVGNHPRGVNGFGSSGT